MAQLLLERPLVFFDLETTGTDVATDRIVEISLLKVYPNNTPNQQLHRYVNPGVPIPPEATAVHGITNEQVANAPTWQTVALEVAGFIEGCDLGGYNCAKFDIPLLAEEFLRVNVPVDLRSRRVVDVQVIFHKKEQRTLSAAYQFYCNKTLTDAHTAAADTQATYEVLLGQLDRYPDLPTDVNGLEKFTKYNNNVDFAGRMVYNEAGEEVINFGKYKGQKAVDILKRDPGYFNWIMEGSFAKDTKQAFRQIMMRIS